jgi:2,4-dienoyl-CoA reductase-like NADH-dependent reductase (Old Yellow Enzyme family)/thioredoxin reductase
LGFFDDSQIEGNKRLTAAVHAVPGAKIAAQIGHSGRQTGFLETGGLQPLAPSGLCCPVRAHKPEDVPREMTIEEINQTIEDFVQAARRVKESGYDAVELHGAHGYLLQQFLSPFSNKRTDRYGGSLYNRARLSLEIIEGIRKMCGEDFPIIYRISMSELMGGACLNIADTKAVCMMLEAAGVAAIHASVGSHFTYGGLPLAPAAVPHGYNIDYAEEAKKVVSIPVFGTGRFTDPYVTEAALKSGKADVIAFARESLSDPDFPNKVKEGRLDDIIYCVGCLQGCIGNHKRNEPIQCLCNPILGHEGEYTWTPVAPKRVAVVGSGIGGLGAAIAAARRGHKVTLFEKGPKLGGQWLMAAVPPSKQELTTLTVWQKKQIEDLKVDVRLNTEFTADKETAAQFDKIILATGAVPFVPPIPGAKLPHVVTAADVLTGRAYIGKRVVVVGGGQVGSETASFLASERKNVTILEMLDKIPTEGEPNVLYFLREELKDQNVEMIAEAKVTKIEDNSISYERKGAAYTIDGVDNVVMAIGSRSVNVLEEPLKELGADVVLVGDAIRPGKGLHAHDEGFKAGYYA